MTLTSDPPGVLGTVLPDRRETQGPADPTAVKAVSVADLIRKRLDPDDPWRLALVQRHLVWDEVRMARLLDSLLAGYSIGSILVCRVLAGGRVLVEKDETRIAEQVGDTTWQLLDGQQRINALVTLFSDQGCFGRFLVDMTVEREREEVVTRRRGKRDTTRYIAWQDDESGTEALAHRERYLDLSRWMAWAGNRTEDELASQAECPTVEGDPLVATLKAIDPKFAPTFDVNSRLTAATRFRQLIHVWSEQKIPVEHLILGDAVDVLQVFTRINSEGVRLDGEDVFFAAVKTLWNDAEENLDRVAGCTTLINRLTALRLLARLASRSLRQGDLMPLKVDRLNGDKGKRLVDVMRRIARDDAPALGRIGRLGRWLTEESQLGHGLRSMNALLLDHVFAWAAVNEKLDGNADAHEWLPAVENFLVGAQAFRWATIFRDTFSRHAFEQAVAAGCNGEPFPVEAIVRAARRQWPELVANRRAVQHDKTESDHREVASANAELFLSIGQRIPYELPLRGEGHGMKGRVVEWDHIYPQALAAHMRVRGESGYLFHHDHRRLVWTAGNLWALDQPLNNWASDKWPSEKFDILERMAGTNGTPTRWPLAEHSFLADGERASLLEAERYLRDALEQEGPPRDALVEKGMECFQAFTHFRSLRLYAEITSRLPEVTRFAPEAEVVAGDPDEKAPVVDVAHALGIDVPEPVEDETNGTITPPVNDGAFASVLALAGTVGVARELEQLIDAGRRVGLYPRPYKSSVMFTPPRQRSRMLFTVWPSKSAGGFDIYRSASAFVEFFPRLEKDDVRARLGPDKWGVLRPEDVAAFVANLRALFTAWAPSTGNDT